MGIHAANNASDAAPDADDISIIPQVDLPTRNDAFTALGRAPPKKSIMEQIRDAETHTSTSLDASSYPKIVDSWAPTSANTIFDPTSTTKNGLPGSTRTAVCSSGLLWAAQATQMAPFGSATGATTSVAKHLKNVHRVYPEGEPPANITGKRSTASIADLVQSQSNKKAKLPPPASTQELFRQLLVKWIADSDIAFSAVENKHFRAFLSLLNPNQVDTLLPKSHHTPRSWLRTIYNRHLDALKTEILATPNKIHISFDGWSSPGTAAFFAVVAHYFDQLGIFQTKLLALPRIKGTHNGENLAKGVIEVVERFSFESKLGFIRHQATTSTGASTEIPTVFRRQVCGGNTARGSPTRTTGPGFWE
jgi:hypothetical protein